MSMKKLSNGEFVVVPDNPRIKRLSTDEFLITLPSSARSCVKELRKAIEDITMLRGSRQYIPLAYYKNGQLKSLLVF